MSLKGVFVLFRNITNNIKRNIKLKMPADSSVPWELTFKSNWKATVIQKYVHTPTPQYKNIPCTLATWQESVSISIIYSRVFPNMNLRSFILSEGRRGGRRRERQTFSAWEGGSLCAFILIQVSSVVSTKFWICSFSTNLCSIYWYFLIWKNMKTLKVFLN